MVLFSVLLISLLRVCCLFCSFVELSAPAPFVSSESRGASTENLASPLYFEFPLSGMGNLPSRDSSGSRSCSVPTSPLCVPRHCSTPFGSIATGDMSRRTGSWPYLATPSPHSTATVQNSLPMIHQPLASPPSIEITEFIPEWAYEDVCRISISIPVFVGQLVIVSVVTNVLFCVPVCISVWACACQCNYERVAGEVSGRFNRTFAFTATSSQFIVAFATFPSMMKHLLPSLR